MITIKNSHETTLIVKNSRFIGFACRADSEEEAQRILEQRRRQHYDARHHCHAYALENGAMRCGDDGEPQGTAGVPMLEVLKKSGLTNVIIICTRYFGGTLLGAGGLVRAYTQSAADTLSAARRVQCVECGVYRCLFDFPAWARAENALASLGFKPSQVRYAQAVTADYFTQPGEDKSFIKAITNITQGKTSPVPLGTKTVEFDI